MLQTFLFAFNQVFSKPKYIALSITAFIFLLSFSIWLPNLNFLHHIVISDTFSSSQKIGIISSVFGSIQTNFSPFSRAITLTVVVLFSINISLFVYFILRAAKLSKEAGISTSGFIFGMIGVGCATCGSVILSSFLGVSATAGFIGILPLKGQEFGLLSIFLLSVSIYFLSKKINDPIVCNVKPATFKFLIRAVPVWLKVFVLIAVAFIAGVIIAGRFLDRGGIGIDITKEALAAKFEKLSQSGNSSCSGTFADSIDTMKQGSRIQGSCCSLMNWHRYVEQVEGLKKYKNIAEIPPDPYDIDSDLAKKMKSHYDDKLNPDQQKEYDFAMKNSDEKGPCCCKCWRWYVYGGLAKYLIQNYNFTGEQITEVWNLSDGCGGEGDHVNHK
ncbi:MAG: hypothetical protein US51_C0044G0009 [Microgenomates group bacterium GW2011_GWA2_37_6]|nr:MAG: hypothetical protein US51_C0044G0009 [Microgenomates group bacterium GW2011_GWA2_37_6]